MNVNVLKNTFPPLLSTFFFMLGNGLLTTLVVVSLHGQNISPFFIGAMTGIFYLGLALGSFRIEPFILRVGHIRAFSTFASFLAIMSLIQGMILNPWIWLLLRFFAGFATAGVFIVIESWLLILGTVKTRGQILSLYMIALYSAQASGQFFINFHSQNILFSFALVAIASSLAIIPLAMAKVTTPQISEPSALSFKKLYQTAASGMIGNLIAGLILGAIYGLLPLFIMQKLGNHSDVALLMALTIFGGMALQYPVGKLSDHIERRSVLIYLSLATVLVSVIGLFFFDQLILAAITTFILGGLTFTLSPISMSHACDNLEHKDIVAGTQGLLLTYSIGATLGPFISPLFMHAFGANGLLIYFIVLSLGLCGFIFWRKLKVADHKQEHFVSLPQTTPVVSEMDPRAE